MTVVAEVRQNQTVQIFKGVVCQSAQQATRTTARQKGALVSSTSVGHRHKRFHPREASLCLTFSIQTNHNNEYAHGAENAR